MIQSLTRRALVLALFCLAPAGAHAQTTIHVASGGNLQTALNTAVGGDTITLEAGAVFTGNFTLPAHTGASMVTVRSVNSGSLTMATTGGITHIDPVASAANMATIRTTNATSALTHTGVPKNWIFIGIVFEATNATETSGVNLVTLGDNTITSAANLPENITFEKCVFKGPAAFGVVASAQRGCQCHVKNLIIRQSHFSGIRSKAAESQTISVWNSPGPFLIEDNYIEAAAIGVLFGGAVSAISGNIQTGITFRRNYVTRPASWQGETGWGMKNLFELKNAQDVVVCGNIFEHNWPDGQSGFPIVFTVRANGFGADWTTIKRVRFEHNIVRHTGAAFNILGQDNQTDGGNTYPSTPMDTVTIHNNLIYDLDRQTWDSPANVAAAGTMFQIGMAPRNLHITNNTFGSATSGNIMSLSGQPMPGFKVQSNIFRKVITPLESYGVFGDVVGEGNPALATYASNVNGYANTIFQDNVLAGATAATYNNWSNLFPSLATLAADFTNAAAGNFRLVGGSAFAGKGADQDAIEAAIAGAGCALATIASPGSPHRLRLRLP
jgi:hypothetical protein